MTAIEAVSAIQEIQRTDRDLALAIAAACQAKGCKDLYDFAAQFPDEIVMMAEQIVDVYDQEAPTNDRVPD